MSVPGGGAEGHEAASQHARTWCVSGVPVPTWPRSGSACRLLASHPPLVFLPQLFPFQLTLAPRFLPNALISVDFAANYLTKIYGLTFGQKPNLRSEVRGGPWA